MLGHNILPCPAMARLKVLFDLEIMDCVYCHEGTRRA